MTPLPEAARTPPADVLERHFADARATVAAFGGETVKTTGDGVPATFTGPARAVRCTPVHGERARENRC